MTDKVIDAEFIDAQPVARPPAPAKCVCPACPTMLAPGVRWCSACLERCVPALRQCHQPPRTPGRGDTRLVVDGIKATARMVDGVESILGALSGKPRRRRMR